LRTAIMVRAAALVLWSLACFVAAGALAAPLERVELQSAAQRLTSGALIAGDRIQGFLAKPEGAGPFPAVVVLHGCAGMFEATKQALADDLVAWGYVVLFVDSFTTRGIDHACTASAARAHSFVTGLTRTSDAYGALVFLARKAFVDPQRVAAVGFSQGAWITLAVAGPNSLDLFVRPKNLRFRAAAAFYPLCRVVGARPEIPTVIFIGALDDWTLASACAERIAIWGKDGPPIELVVYPGTYHGFYYTHMQPGRRMFGHWIEYNGAAAANARLRMRAFLERYLK
jgi:dienelactone hydrolase